MPICRVGIISDIHYASAAEQARGNDYEYRNVANPLLRQLVRIHRRHVWLRNPLHSNHLLDQFLAVGPGFDLAVANGDYSCNTASVGLSDDAACESARECIGKLRAAFGERLHAVIGDHEFGKFSLVGRRGGMRLASLRRVVDDLKIEPFWQCEVGRYTLLGVASPLVALPVYETETLPQELPEWRRFRQEHLLQIRQAFQAVRAEQRILLFCHDPTALPFLWQEEAVRDALPAIEQTIIGHLHSNLILRMARILSGLPRITFFGHTVRRLSTALRQARLWKPFRVRLCPSPSGIELLKDGGFLVAELDPDARAPARFTLHPINR